ncbi:MAG: hypothetical protein OXC26_24520 [Albidovulum sp.]|nr:hypothetical protein [Albidovulum sp.]
MSFVVALLAIAGFGYLELLLLRYAMYSSFGLGDLFFVWAISPIVSITAIMIFILIGVFRGFLGTELDGMPNYANKWLGGNSPEQ